ncbi:serine hydrolase domain-containing protein [Sphingomicrobium sp. XHP0239]|uniref:serine hydrolase domain-containing protein n=1 Tax=Sphingomicrobium maritimum TaxID=3133972 RepID=UPI0031CC62B2
MNHIRLTQFGLPLAAIVAFLGGIGVLDSSEVPAEQAGPAHVPLAAPSAVSGGSVNFARLDARVTQLMDEHGPMAGLAVGVVLDGEIAFLKGYGTRTAADDGEPVDVNTVFRWASVSKGVAGVMAAKLDEEGALRLDRPIASYSSTLTLPENNHFSATLRDTLSHRLGIWRNAYDDKLEDGQDPDDIRRQLGELVQICPVGSCWSYQNVAFDAASEAVEMVTGAPYDTALKSHLFAPLGMTRASATRDGLMMDDNWAHPFNRGGREYDVTDAYYRVPAAGGVNSSIIDATIWLQAQMGHFPEILPDAAIETAHQPLIETPGEMRRMRDYRERLSDARYGLGWRTYDYAGHRIVGHRGGVDGYRSFILFDPEREAGIVAFWNSDTGQPHGLQFEFFDMLYGLETRDWLELDG